MRSPALQSQFNVRSGEFRALMRAIRVLLSPFMKTIDPDWLPKEEAAELLGVSIRQLENRTLKGEIRKKTLPRLPNERAARVMYSIEDLKAINAGSPNHYGEPAASSVPRASDLVAVITGRPNHSGAPAAGDPFAGLAAHLAALAKAFPPPAEAKPWLTLAEAAAYSGLPAAWLVAQAREGGKKWVVNVGQGTKAHWRFNREALARA